MATGENNHVIYEILAARSRRIIEDLEDLREQCDATVRKLEGLKAELVKDSAELEAIEEHMKTLEVSDE